MTECGQNETKCRTGPVVAGRRRGCGAAGSCAARAMIDGETGPTFSLTARAGHISISDGGSIYSWGYSLPPLP